ncbi:hypothetical protein HanRHA438_Chr08g0333541 [Helianthus annuus]|nr:hypothetical protein HanRHA438_Chr08g0333541 [Helianthus annuus]
MSRQPTTKHNRHNDLPANSRQQPRAITFSPRHHFYILFAIALLSFFNLVNCPDCPS